jgi:hypothetical protein
LFELYSASSKNSAIEEDYPSFVGEIAAARSGLSALNISSVTKLILAIITIS